MKCKRCGKDIEADAPNNVDVCGSCADDLRQEEEYQIMVAQEEAKADQMDKDAYEEEIREQQQESEYRYL